MWRLSLKSSSAVNIPRPFFPRPKSSSTQSDERDPSFTPFSSPLSLKSPLFYSHSARGRTWQCMAGIWHLWSSSTSSSSNSRVKTKKSSHKAQVTSRKKIILPLLRSKRRSHLRRFQRPLSLRMVTQRSVTKKRNSLLWKKKRSPNPQVSSLQLKN